MCDCPEDKKKLEKDVGTFPETVTLFEKCEKPYRPGKDMTIHLTAPDDKVQRAERVIQFLPNSNEGIACGVPEQQLIASSNSSSSSRTYKFVSPQELECYCPPDEGEAPEPFIYEPCTVFEEEPEEEADIEQTLAIIKPEAMIYKDQIEKRIHEEGFETLQTRWLQLTPEQVSEFYCDNYGQCNFAHLVAYMASGPILVLVLAKHRAIQDWRFIMGPTKVTEARLYFPDSIRAKYGRKGEDFKNAVHGSCNSEKAEKEIHFFFPESVIEPLLRGEAAVDFLWQTVNPILTEGLTMCCKLKPADPLLWLANWLILNNPNKPRLPQDLALIPT